MLTDKTYMIDSIKNTWEVKVYVSTFPLRQRMVVHLSTTVSRLVIQECFLLKPYWWDGNKCIGNNYLCRPSLLDSSRPINYWVYNWRSTKLVRRYSEADWTVSSNSFWCLVLASCSLSECMYILVICVCWQRMLWEWQPPLERVDRLTLLTGVQ